MSKWNATDRRRVAAIITALAAACGDQTSGRGGQAALARALRCRRQMVHKWIDRGAVTPRYAMRIAELAAAKSVRAPDGTAVEAHHICPQAKILNGSQ